MATRVTFPRKTHFSALQTRQRAIKSRMPSCLQDEVVVKDSQTRECDAAITSRLPTTAGASDVLLARGSSGDGSSPPLRVGVVLSGGQAPGGHNVIAGVYDFVKEVHPASKVIGFLGGPIGIITGKYTEVDEGLIFDYRNMGGFDMIGSGRHKIDTPEQFAESLKFCTELDLNGLIIIGGDDSNTNAALLAEYFQARGSKCRVIGVPKTIDGDLKILGRIPVSFGFDTATRTFAEMVGNIMSDALSSQKYYHFVRLMGRSASHIALEVALQTRPNLCFIGEEVAEEAMSLHQLTMQVVECVMDRAQDGNHYGVIIVPEGLIEFVPEVKKLISEINEVLAKGIKESYKTFHTHLSRDNARLFQSLPKSIKLQLLLDRDSHGNVAVSRIETEKLLSGLVEMELDKRRKNGSYTGYYNPHFHFFGYDGRSGLPSVFDNSYCYALGATAAALIRDGRNGLMASVSNLNKPVDEWTCGGVSIAAMMHLERRGGKDKEVIKKALVELDGCPFRALVAQREAWARGDYYRSPGPMQLDGDAAVQLNHTTRLEIGGETELARYLAASPPAFSHAGAEERKSNKRRRTGGEAGDGAGAGAGAGTPAGGRASGSGSGSGAGAGSGSGAGDDGDVDMSAETPDGGAPARQSDLGSRFSYTPRILQLLSPLQRERLTYKPQVPPIMCDSTNVCAVSIGGRDTQSVADSKFLKAMFPTTFGQPLLELRPSRPPSASAGSGSDRASSPPSVPAIRIGVVFCGRQAAGGSNIVWGMYERIKRANPASVVIGFEGGTQGMFARRGVTITDERLAMHRNQGGYELLGRSVDQIKTDPQVRACQATCQAMALDGLVLIGGTHTASYGAALAERFVASGLRTRIIVAPSGIDNDIKSDHVETSVGHHTATRVYSQLIGNIATDANSAKKYWHFVRLMGRKPSHIVLECALQTQPNVVLIGEEVEARRLTLQEVTNQVADAVVARSRAGKNFGVVLVPEGIISHIPEMTTLINEMNQLFAQGVVSDDMAGKLTPWSAALLAFLPKYIQRQLILDREVNGQVQLSQIESEKLFAGLVGDELEKRRAAGTYVGKYATVCSFNGYEARCSLPTQFDCDYGFTLGCVAANLVQCGVTGYLASVRRLKAPVAKWVVGAAPLSALAVVERQLDGSLSAIVKPTKVDLNGNAFRALMALRRRLVNEELYINPGPIQFNGPTAGCRAKTLCLEENDYMDKLKVLHQHLDTVREMCKPGCSRETLETALAGLSAVTRILGTLRARSTMYG